MKLMKIGCKTMREGVIVSLIFFTAGVLMMLTGAMIVPDIAYMKQIVLFVGFLLLLFAPVVLVATFLLSVTPGARERMDNCEH